jgi:hypothetical protein
VKQSYGFGGGRSPKPPDASCVSNTYSHARLIPQSFLHRPKSASTPSTQNVVSFLGNHLNMSCGPPQ